MDTVFQFLFQFLGQFFGSIFNGIVTMLGAFNIPEYISIITRYANTLGGLAWVVAIIATLLLVAGSAIFNASDKAAAVRAFKELR